MDGPAVVSEDLANVLPMFDVDQLVDAQPVGGVGRVERALRTALHAAAEVGIIGVTDAGLIGAALAGARGLDVAERGGAKGGPYATAALLTPYRETLHALRIPEAVNPSDEPRGPAEGQPDGASFLSDLYGAAAD